MTGREILILSGEMRKDMRLVFDFPSGWVKFGSRNKKYLMYAVLALALITSLALAACGGGDDDSPTPTLTPTATTAPGGNGGGGETPGGNGGGGVTPGPSSGAAELFIRDRGFDIVDVNLNAGDILKVTYDTIGATTGGPQSLSGEGVVTSQIELVILNPIDERILTVEAKRGDTVEVQADITGKYQLVFTNPFALQAISVTVEYAINP